MSFSGSNGVSRIVKDKRIVLDCRVNRCEEGLRAHDFQNKYEYEQIASVTLAYV